MKLGINMKDQLIINVIHGISVTILILGIIISIYNKTSLPVSTSAIVAGVLYNIPLIMNILSLEIQEFPNALEKTMMIMFFLGLVAFISKNDTERDHMSVKKIIAGSILSIFGISGIIYILFFKLHYKISEDMLSPLQYMINSWASIFVTFLVLSFCTFFSIVGLIILYRTIKNKDVEQ